jgi:hypothetical protein
VTALATIGFARQGKGRHFIHPDTKFYVEFPPGPLMVGDERVEQVSERQTPVGKLRLLSPTDCVMDRLAAFFHWNDRQALEQAVMVANTQKVDLGEIRRWSKAERNEEKFALFEKRAASRLLRSIVAMPQMLGKVCRPGSVAGVSALNPQRAVEERRGNVRRLRPISKIPPAPLKPMAHGSSRPRRRRARPRRRRRRGDARDAWAGEKCRGWEVLLEWEFLPSVEALATRPASGGG